MWFCPPAQSAFLCIGVIPRFVCGDRRGQRCLHNAWSNRVHSDAEWSKLSSQRPAHLKYTSFSCGVHALSWFHRNRPNACESDDASLSSLLHITSRRRNQAESSLEIQVDDSIKLLL